MKNAVVVRREIAKTITPLRDACHVVLQEPNGGYKTKLPLDGWHEAIVFDIHDITRQIEGYIHFTEEDARRLIDFMKRNDGRPMLINCDAGISRSVAVGCLLRDFFGYKVEFLSAGTDQYRNSLIYRTVSNIMNGYKE